MLNINIDLSPNRLATEFKYDEEAFMDVLAEMSQMNNMDHFFQMMNQANSWSEVHNAVPDFLRKLANAIEKRP